MAFGNSNFSLFLLFVREPFLMSSTTTGYRKIERGIFGSSDFESFQKCPVFDDKFVFTRIVRPGTQGFC